MLNTRLRKILRSKTGLPASAIVGHALLSEDLGLSGQLKIELIEVLEEVFELKIPAEVYAVLTRVEDLEEYIQFEKSFTEQELGIKF